MNRGEIEKTIAGLESENRRLMDERARHDEQIVRKQNDLARKINTLRAQLALEATLEGLTPEERQSALAGVREG